MSNQVKPFDELLERIIHYNNTIDIPALLRQYINEPDKELKNRLIELSEAYEADMIDSFKYNISKIKEKKLEEFIHSTTIDFLRNYINKKDDDETKGELFKFFNTTIAPAKQCFGELDIPITIKVITSFNSNITYKRMLSKSINICKEYDDKMLSSLSRDTASRFSIELLKNVFNRLYVIFHEEEAEVYQKAYVENTDKQLEIIEKMKIFTKNHEFETNKARLSLLEEEMNFINSEFDLNIIGYNDLLEIEKVQSIDFNFEQFKKYIQRVSKFGPYKDLEAKEKFFDKIVSFKTSSPETKEVVPCNLLSDYITSDYSSIGNSIIKSLGEDATVESPYIDKIIYNKKDDNYTLIGKTGPAISSNAIVFFHYILGEIEEYSSNDSKSYNILFDKVEFCKAIGKKSYSDQWNYLESMLDELGHVSIVVSNENGNSKRVEKMTKWGAISKKKMQLLQYELVEYENGSISLGLTVPLLEYLRPLGEFGRFISRDIRDVMFKRPRVYLIAYYLSRQYFINNKKEQKFNRNLKTLIKGIGEETIYNKYSNKRMYLSKLFRDIEDANNCMLNGIKFDYIKCSPNTIGSCKISICKNG